MFLLRRQLHSNGVGDLAREHALQDHDVAERSFVPIRPEVLFGTDLDHLRADTHPFGGTEHRAGDERVDAQLPGDLRRPLTCLLQWHDRRAGDHAQRADLRELGDEVVRHAISEVLLFRIARQVLERQNRDRANGRPMIGGRDVPGSNRPDAGADPQEQHRACDDQRSTEAASSAAPVSLPASVGEVAPEDTAGSAASEPTASSPVHRTAVLNK